jgi:hypothetical protein
MSIIVGAGGALLIAAILWDAFETVVLPRRVTRRLGPARLLVRGLWALWRGVARRVQDSARRETYLSIFGPLSLILLLAFWAGCLILGFAMLQWALGSQFDAPEPKPGFGTDLYVRGTTFFTLGLGNVAPRSGPARVLTVIEAGIGFGFLALVLAYLLVLFQEFSRREVHISMLDEWAGTPPSAAELLSRLARYGSLADPGPYLASWEVWAAELMEIHLSYPILAYFRSQHDAQSWIAALTTILDVCALAIVGIDGVPRRPAYLTFAMARHAIGDLSHVLAAPPRPPAGDRLPPEDLARLRAVLTAAGVILRAGPAADEQLAALRRLYEPYVNALALHLLMPLPPWLPDPAARDNWLRTAWERADTLPLG